MREYKLPAFFDAHVHLRQGGLLGEYARHTAAYCDAALVMPNTEPPITTAEGLVDYRRQCEEAMPGVKVLMTAKLTPATTPALVREMADAGAVGFKLYPDGVTTNSGGGIPGPWLCGEMHNSLLEAIGAMQATGLVLLHHGEMPGVFCLDREEDYLRVVSILFMYFPLLRQTLEHVTTAAGVVRVTSLHDEGFDILGTITYHHLLLTLDDVIGDTLRPDHFCKPVAKRPLDRATLLDVALSGHPAFALGSDSAPHPQDKKYGASGCAGVYSAPVLDCGLVELFHQNNSVDNLAAFGGDNARKFYGLQRSGRTVSYEDTGWLVPAYSDGATPFRAGQRLQWSRVS